MKSRFRRGNNSHPAARNSNGVRHDVRNADVDKLVAMNTGSESNWVQNSDDSWVNNGWVNNGWVNDSWSNDTYRVLSTIDIECLVERNFCRDIAHWIPMRKPEEAPILRRTEKFDS